MGMEFRLRPGGHTAYGNLIVCVVGKEEMRGPREG